MPGTVRTIEQYFPPAEPACAALNTTDESKGKSGEGRGRRKGKKEGKKGNTPTLYEGCQFQLKTGAGVSTLLCKRRQHDNIRLAEQPLSSFGSVLPSHDFTAPLISLKNE
ncbi:MAG: hypothetical protein Q9163_005027 [Psora crenata]